MRLEVQGRKLYFLLPPEDGAVLYKNVFIFRIEMYSYCNCINNTFLIYYVLKVLHLHTHNNSTYQSQINYNYNLRR